LPLLLLLLLQLQLRTIGEQWTATAGIDPERHCVPKVRS
jgi:hypothetical protein